MAAQLIYGNGDCTIESGGTEVRGVEIRYTGNIKITKKTGDKCKVLMARENGILIFVMGQGFLSDLFSYVGEFKITSVIVGDKDGNRIPTVIKKSMHHSEIMRTNAEDMTIKSEDLDIGYIYKSKVNKTIVFENILEDQESNGELYLRDGTVYNGNYHVHLDTGKAMTGNKHTRQSVLLYTKVKNKNKLIRTGTTIRNRKSTKNRRTSGMGNSH